MSASDATFPKLLRGLATKNPDQTALQEKRYGIWQPMSWSTYAARVQDFAHGMARSMFWSTAPRSPHGARRWRPTSSPMS